MLVVGPATSLTICLTYSSAYLYMANLLSEVVIRVSTNYMANLSTNYMANLSTNYMANSMTTSLVCLALYGYLYGELARLPTSLTLCPPRSYAYLANSYN